MHSPDELLHVIYKGRVFAWALATLMAARVFALAGAGAVGIVIIVALALYPHCLQVVLQKRVHSITAVRASLMVDAPLVGLLVAIFGFELAPLVVFGAMLIIGIVIIGGLGQLLFAIPLFLVCAVAGHYLLPAWLVSAVPLDAYLFVSLLLYISFVAWLVYEETRRLGAATRRESSLRARVAGVREQLIPFIGSQVLDRAADGQSRRQMTVFFSDLVGFTDLMDTCDERQVADLLGEYFEAMTRIALVHGGTVDKFLGDGIMVFFGDPRSRGPAQDARACVAMALEMREHVYILSLRWQQRLGGRQLRLRIGIHSGYCLVGSFGCESRMDYTVLGKAVNLASRLETCAEHDEILISGQTFRLVSQWIVAIPRGQYRLKGLSEPVPVFAVQGLVKRDVTYRAPYNPLLP